MSTQDSIGKVLGDDAHRDAIHVAVEPVTSAEKLYPGDRLALVSGDQSMVFRCDDERTVGIVDPFLTRPVNAGQRFYMFLLPNTITSLRHQWTHPAFADEAVIAASAKETSEAWLRNFAATNDAPPYEEMIAAAVRGPEDHGDLYLLIRGMDAHCTTPEEFWHHVQIVTGREIPPARRATHFSCSC